MNFEKTLRAAPGRRVRLDRIDAADHFGIKKEAAEPRIETNVDRLDDLQYRLYVEGRRSLLVVLQGMDTSGKDGVIRHVMRGFNPQGCAVVPFKAPTDLERRHDFLWRIHAKVPPAGEIAIFNRSHYEDVVVVRVHDWISKAECRERYEEINRFERFLSRNGVTVVKFFLHISKGEQKERLEKRLKDPRKNWKFNENDVKERKLWRDYQKAYEDALSHCSTDHAPWYVIPSDRKWFRNLAISEVLCERLEALKIKNPSANPALKHIRFD